MYIKHVAKNMTFKKELLHKIKTTKLNLLNPGEI